MWRCLDVRCGKRHLWHFLWFLAKSLLLVRTALNVYQQDLPTRSNTMVGLFIWHASCMLRYCKMWQVNEGGEATSFDKVQAHQMAKKNKGFAWNSSKTDQRFGLHCEFLFCGLDWKKWKHSSMIVFFFMGREWWWVVISTLVESCRSLVKLSVCSPKTPDSIEFTRHTSTGPSGGRSGRKWQTLGGWNFTLWPCQYIDDCEQNVTSRCSVHCSLVWGSK